MAEFDPIRSYRFTSEEFRKKKAEYVAKYGYTVVIPGVEDVVHYKRFPPMTETEKTLWKARMYDEIPEARREEIRAEKARKKQKFLNMLGSPTPDIVRNAGTIMTALDDAQDTVSTLACIGMLAVKILPKTLGKWISGPVGWAMLASDVMNLINPYSAARKYLGTGTSGRASKRMKDRLTENNPSTRKGKLKTARKIRKFRPSTANVCEALQTTDQFFGVGISLGPIVGYLQDTIFGVGRQIMGEKVTLKGPAWLTKQPERTALRAYETQFVTGLYEQESDPDDEINHKIAHHFATQVLYDHIQESDLMSMVEDTDTVIYSAPEPTDILTLEIIEETTGLDDMHIGLPGINAKTAEFDDILYQTQRIATAKNEKFQKENRHDIEAMCAAESQSLSALNMMAAIEGADEIRTDYTAHSKIVHKIFDNGWMYPEGITEEQIGSFEWLCNYWERSELNPTSARIQAAARHWGRFNFVMAPDLSGW